MKLKTLLLTGLTALSMNALKAQEIKTTTDIDTVTVFQQDSLPDNQETMTLDEATPFRITSGYAGQIAAVGFNTKDASDVSFGSSTRIGGGAAYDIIKNTSLNAWSVLDVSPNEGESFAFGQAFLRSELGKYVVLNGGLIATPATLLRPFPISWSGHFETSTDMLIPGGATGVRMDVNGKLNASAGFAMRNGAPEYGASIGYKGTDGALNLATWIQNEDIFGVVLSGSYKALSGTVVWNETAEQSRVGTKVLYMVNLPGRKGSIALFSVLNRDRNMPEDQMMMNSLHGLLAVGEVDVGNTPVNIVLGPGYDVVNKRIAVYLQIALQR